MIIIIECFTGLHSNVVRFPIRFFFDLRQNTSVSIWPPETSETQPVFSFTSVGPVDSVVLSFYKKHQKLNDTNFSFFFAVQFTTAGIFPPLYISRHLAASRTKASSMCGTSTHFPLNTFACSPPPPAL